MRSLLLAILALFCATARADGPAFVLRAHLTPDALAAWQADTTKSPELLDAAEIDNHDPAHVVVRSVLRDRILSAEWSAAGTEITTAGEEQAVLEAKRYTLRTP